MDFQKAMFLVQRTFTLVTSVPNKATVVQGVGTTYQDTHMA